MARNFGVVADVRAVEFLGPPYLSWSQVRGYLCGCRRPVLSAAVGRPGVHVDAYGDIVALCGLLQRRPERRAALKAEG